MSKLKITKRQGNGWKIDGRKAGRFAVFEEICQPLNGLQYDSYGDSGRYGRFFQLPYFFQTSVK